MPLPLVVVDFCCNAGGIAKKVEEAACIARKGIPVIIANAKSDDARAALLLGSDVGGKEGHKLLGRPFRGTIVSCRQ